MCLKLCDSHLILPISNLADSHVLTIPAFLGDITSQNIKQALESTRQQDVNNWIDESIGQSSLSSIRKAVAKTEQN